MRPSYICRWLRHAGVLYPPHRAPKSGAAILALRQGRAQRVDLLYIACAVVIGLALAIETWTTKEALLLSPALWLGISAAVVIGALVLNA